MNVMMLFMKGNIKSDYVKGLSKLKQIIAENPYTWEIKEIDITPAKFIL